MIPLRREKRLIFIVLFSILFISFVQTSAFSKEIVLHNFENGPQGWAIPDWAIAKDDNAAQEVCVSEYYASEGTYSFELKVNFPGGSTWKGAYVECPVGVTDWTPFGWLSADIYLPPDAPRGLRAKVILTVGEKWEWTESNKSVRLTPGEWTVMRVNLLPESLDWRRFVTDEFRSDVKKIGIRIESNGVAYTGSVFIDNIKLSEE